MIFSFAIFILILILLLFSSLLIFSIIQTKKYPYCGGYLNPNSIPKCNAIDCNSDRENFESNLIDVIEYLLEILKNTPDTLIDDIKTRFQDTTNLNIIKGIFYFAPPELLNILRSDFGQNKSTPYGIISFFNTYVSCISDIQDYCYENLKNSPQLDVVCNLLRVFARRQQCPFTVKDSNTNLYIPDKKFFNNIGMLGAFSLDFNQIIMMRIRLPVRDLHLNYWSLNIYMADNLDPDLICHPYLNLSVASLDAPLNMYTAVGLSSKKFNPITGEGDLVEPGFINFISIICLNRSIADDIASRYKNHDASIDFFHVFKIPTAQGSMTIDPCLPNPNHLGAQSTLFNPINQRLTMFMRLSPDPSVSDKGSDFFNHFISDTKGKYIQIALLDFDNTMYPVQKYPTNRLPPIVHPPFNEYSEMTYYQGLKKTLRNHLSFHNRIYHLKMRNSTLNIFGPQFKTIIDTTKPYQGGWQALQLGGNGQGDNYDAQYRLSESTCLDESQVLISMCVNHAFYDNAIYNSINLVDLNRGKGVIAFNYDASHPYNYYIILFGRNMESINRIEDRIKIKNVSVSIQKYYIDPNDVPVCHRVLLVERIYLNPNYQSSTTNKMYSLFDLFGKDLKGLNKDHPQDRWSSLVDIACPRQDYLFPPNFLLMTPTPISIYLGIILIITFVILVLFIIFRNRIR